MYYFTLFQNENYKIENSRKWMRLCTTRPDLCINFLSQTSHSATYFAGSSSPRMEDLFTNRIILICAI